MNRQQLRARVRGRLGLPETGTPRLTEPTQNDNLNEALRRISSEKRWPWLLTSSAMSWASVADDEVPTDFMHPRVLMVGDYQARYVDLAQFLQANRIGCVWTMVGRNARLAPTPTSTVTGTLFYYRHEPDLSTDASIPLVPTGYQDAIIHYAAHLGALNLQNAQLAADELGLYNQFMRGMDDGSTGAPAGRHVRTQQEIRSYYASWT